jgi:hypothetical protein
MMRTGRIAALLSVAIALALATNAMAGVFCSHAIGHCCVHSAVAQGDKSGNAPKMHHHEMEGMESSDESMDAMYASADHSDCAQLASNDDSAPMKAEPAMQTEYPEAITQPDEPCSHCAVHSKVNSNSSLRVAGQNTPASQFTPMNAATVFVGQAVPIQRVLEIHDHGPPGSCAPLYVLINSFRI